MVKILQAKLQLYVNWELSDVQAGFRKGRGTRDQIANICWITEKARELQRKQGNSRKASTSTSLIMLEPLTVWITTNCGKFLKRPPYLSPKKPVCRSRSNRMGHRTMDWFQIGKGVRQGGILSPCLFNLYSEYIMWNARLDEAQAGIKIAGRNINNLRYTDDTTPMTESEEELNSLLLRVKEKSEKGWLKAQLSKNYDHSIQSHHFTANWWGKCGNSDYSHEIRRHLLLGRKAMKNSAY